MDEVLVQVTASVINHQIDGVTSRLSGEIKSFWMQHLASFRKYINSANKRYEVTKTLLYKDQAVPLRDLYVGTGLRRGRKEVTEIEFVEQLLQGNRCLVSATAGAGKSFFSKWLFLKILSTKNSIPLIIELRNLNGTGLGFIDYLISDLKSNFEISMTSSELIKLIESGKFTLILDGYDELTAERINAVNSELLSLEVPFAESSIVITTRPGGENIEYLSGFTTYQVLPLKLSQAISLVKKLKYDEKVKKSFLLNLENELFNKHKDFLSNPLLLTIMLMTYGDLAEIPSKMHIFYEQAFDTLFYRHDSSKGMYRRELKCQLAIDDFKGILSCVSASSYIRGQVTLTNTDLVAFIRKAKQTANVNKLNPRKYIDDLVQSVCLLLEDGTKYTYNHRSFQEYFAALFLIQIPTERKTEVYKRFLSKEGTDNALSLAFEMNQSMVEREFVKPMLESLLEVSTTPEALICACMSGINLERRVKSRMVDGKRVKQLGMPTYRVLDETDYWKFQIYVEHMYQKEAKKHIKFGVLTKKSFVEEFGKLEYRETIDFENELCPISSSKLERLGITEVSKNRLEFLHWLIKDINVREQRTGDSNLETWL